MIIDHGGSRKKYIPREYRRVDSRRCAGYFGIVRILVYSFYFPPHGGPGALRPVKFMRYGTRHGLEFAVVASAPGDYNVRDESLLEEIPPGTLVLRTPEGADPLKFIRDRKPKGIHAPKSDYFFLPDNKIWWIRPAHRLGVLAEFEPDIVWATCPPYSAALAARRTARELGVPLALDFRDPWTRNPNRPKLPPPHRAFNRYLARKTLRSADLVTGVYRAIVDEVRELAPEVRVAHLPNGYDSADFPDELPSPEPGNTLELFYLGTIYPGLNYPLPNLEALAERQNVKLTVAGRYPECFRDHISRLGISERVNLLGYLPRKEALERAAGADALLLYIDGRPLNAGQITSKSYEYLGLERPILAAVPPGGAAEELLGNYETARIIPPGSAKEAGAALDKLLEPKRNGNLPSGDRPPELSREALTEKWIMLLRELL